LAEAEYGVLLSPKSSWSWHGGQPATGVTVTANVTTALPDPSHSP
jgi:hypothetical protein